ncbi:hypothetical protein [Leuconostoc pseudomesenteroides]|uniref:hypothetical protein n=1 Tax=Leuconostoc pseudomesenteroides TaxID=33968 RepID=UPI0032DEF7B6
MMKDALEIKIEQTKRLAKRKAYLSKKYKETLAQDLPLQVRTELAMIDALLENADVSEDTFRKQPSTIGIRNSRDEEWYFQQMMYWINKNPNAVDGQFGRSSIYKFALHFFVENVVLNPRNSSSTLNQLIDKMANLTTQKSNIKINAQNKNIEDSLSFMMAMIYQLVDHIPETVDHKDIDYKLNPLSEIEIKTGGTETDLNDNAEFKNAFDAFKEVRERDKQKLKKINQSTGVLHDD